MAAQKTRKVLDINVEGINFICIYAIHDDRNKYRLFKRWFDGGMWHRQKVAYYGNFVSVLCYLKDYAFDNYWGFKDR